MLNVAVFSVAGVPFSFGLPAVSSTGKTPMIEESHVCSKYTHCPC